MVDVEKSCTVTTSSLVEDHPQLPVLTGKKNVNHIKFLMSMSMSFHNMYDSLYFHFTDNTLSKETPSSLVPAAAPHAAAPSDRTESPLHLLDDWDDLNFDVGFEDLFSSVTQGK